MALDRVEDGVGVKAFEQDERDSGISRRSDRMGHRLLRWLSSLLDPKRSLAPDRACPRHNYFPIERRGDRRSPDLVRHAT